MLPTSIDDVARRTPAPLATEIGVRLRSRREGLGMSQEAFAEAAGVHRTYVGLVERGETNLTIRTLMTFTTALDMRASDLLLDIESSI